MHDHARGSSSLRYVDKGCSGHRQRPRTYPRPETTQRPSLHVEGRCVVKESTPPGELRVKRTGDISHDVRNPDANALKPHLSLSFGSGDPGASGGMPGVCCRFRLWCIRGLPYYAASLSCWRIAASALSAWRQLIKFAASPFVRIAFSILVLRYPIAHSFFRRPSDGGPLRHA